jgi:hypothetical protein
MSNKLVITCGKKSITNKIIRLGIFNSFEELPSMNMLLNIVIAS